MKTPDIDATIGRRLLVNYRADPDVVARLLPSPLRPQLVRGQAVVGICMIRQRVRPAGWPAVLGIGSQSAAHRIAVAWDGPDGERTGVFIPRRDTNGPANVLVGGRLFPGSHHPARFLVDEHDDTVHLAYATKDGSTRVAVAATILPAERPLAGELFADLAEASAFFRGGSLGLSPTRRGDELEGVELRCDAWSMEPVALGEVTSTYFGDRDRFPAGSITLDHGLVMRDLPVRWHAVGRLAAAIGSAPSLVAR